MPIAHVVILGLLLVGFLVERASSATTVQYGLLIAAAALAMKHFGHKGDDADEDVQGTHPIARFQFKAANTGDLEDAQDLVAEDFRAYANGYAMLNSEINQGPDLFVELIDYIREAIPDLHWELYDEVAGRQEDKSELVVLRFVAAGTIAGTKRDIEIASFNRVVDKELAEIRFVTDMTVFNEYRAAIGLPILE